MPKSIQYFIFAVFCCASACSTPPTGGGGGGGFACAPGATQACLCAPKVNGIQVCASDGKSWLTCQCGADDAASGDSGGKSGDATAGDGPDAAGDSNTSNNSDLVGGDESGQTDAVNSVQDGAAQKNETSDGQGGADVWVDAQSDDSADWGNYFDDVADDAGPADASGKDGAPADSGLLDNCNERAKIVYVVTEQNDFLSFDPETLKFKLIGKLNCANDGSTPFSMSVDRNADAWVLYQAGFGGGGEKLYKVSTLDASCQNTNYQSNQSGFTTYGMGFSSDAAGSNDETLFLGKYTMFGASQLGTLSFPNLKVTSVAPLPNGAASPELSGNGLGELYGFFPASNPPSVRRIDKATGATPKIWPLPVNQFSGINAWAFAQWGGDFYLFFKTFSMGSSSVWKLDSTTGIAKSSLVNIGYTITGAGVSSCAPSSTLKP